MNNEKDMLWSDFWTGFQSNNARISWSIRIKADWYKKGIIWLNIASLHMPWKSNQIFKTFKDVICFYNPNSLYDIYWTYPRQEQGVRVVKRGRPIFFFSLLFSFILTVVINFFSTKLITFFKNHKINKSQNTKKKVFFYKIFILI